MVQMQKRQQAGVTAPSEVRAFHVRSQQPGGKPPGPFVEVSHYDARRLQREIAKQLRRYQLSALMPPLDQASAQVRVEDVQHARAIQIEIGAQAAALLATL